MTSTGAPRVEFKVHFQATRRGKKRAVIGERPAGAAAPAGNLPRVTRLMALAIRFDGLVRDGEFSTPSRKRGGVLVYGPAPRGAPGPGREKVPPLRGFRRFPPRPPRSRS